MPDGLDLATIFAESLMDLSPWDYWDQQSGEPKHAALFIAAIHPSGAMRAILDCLGLPSRR